MSNCKTSLTNIASVERDPVFLSQKAKPGGVATLDANGKVPLSQIDIKAMFTERDPVYTADRAQPFGCATLDGRALVINDQLGTGTPTASTFLRGDRTWSPLGTGVQDSTTFLRGDGVWAVPPGGGGGAAEGWKLTGTDVSLDTSTNKVVVGGLPTIAKFGVVGDNPADVTTIIKAAAAQSADILEIQNSSGTTLVMVSAAGKVGIGVAPGAFMLNVAGDARIAGKLTVTGAIDPTSILLSGGTALYYESNDGSTAPVSGVNTGRLRYNNTTGAWEQSTKSHPYVPIGDIHDVFRYSMLHNLA